MCKHSTPFRQNVTQTICKPWKNDTALGPFWCSQDSTTAAGSALESFKLALNTANLIKTIVVTLVALAMTVIAVRKERGEWQRYLVPEALFKMRDYVEMNITEAQAAVSGVCEIILFFVVFIVIAVFSQGMTHETTVSTQWDRRMELCSCFATQRGVQHGVRRTIPSRELCTSRL